MSFSFGAAGTKAETLDSLGKLADSGMTDDGQAVRELVTMIVDEAAGEGADGTPVRFAVSASGHTGEGQVPFLTVSIRSEYVK